jgi:hypothetical protein
MDFEWDERKRQANLAKHGVDFLRAIRIWENDRVLIIEDRRRDYRERRFQAFGFVDGMLLMAAFTWRGRQCRLISARRASRDERQAYRESVGRGGTSDE